MRRFLTTEEYNIQTRQATTEELSKLRDYAIRQLNNKSDRLHITYQRIINDDNTQTNLNIYKRLLIFSILILISILLFNRGTWCFISRFHTYSLFDIARMGCPILLEHRYHDNYNESLMCDPQINSLVLKSIIQLQPDMVNLICDTLEYPLHIYARIGCLECCQLLLQNGATRHAINHFKQTPFMLAKTKELAMLLKEEEEEK